MLHKVTVIVNRFGVLMKNIIFRYLDSALVVIRDGYRVTMWNLPCLVVIIATIVIPKPFRQVLS